MSKGDLALKTVLIAMRVEHYYPQAAQSRPVSQPQNCITTRLPELRTANRRRDAALAIEDPYTA